MALPPQAIEKLIQEPSNTQGAYKELLFLSSALLLIMLVLYFGLAFGYKAYLDRAIAKEDERIAVYSQRISQADQEATANFYSQLVNLRQLLGSHTVASPAFDILERTVHPNVYYTKVNLNMLTNEVNVNGAARNLEDVAQQAALIEGEAGVVKVNFSNAGLQNGTWNFTMSIFLEPGVLHKNGAQNAVLNGVGEPPAPTSTASSSATTSASSSATGTTPAATTTPR